MLRGHVALQQMSLGHKVRKLGEASELPGNEASEEQEDPTFTSQPFIRRHFRFTATAELYL